MIPLLATLSILTALPLVEGLSVNLHQHSWQNVSSNGSSNESSNGSVSDIGGFPKVVYLCGPFEPEETVARNRKFMPDGTQFRYYGYEEMDQSVKNISKHLESHGVHGAYAAYQQLRPYSFRADLWRYMVLWENGGIYMDPKMTLLADVRELIKAENDGRVVACYDNWRATDPHHPRLGRAVTTSLVGARAGEPILLKAIKRSVANIYSHYYGRRHVVRKNLFITGPGLLLQAMHHNHYKPYLHCWSGGRTHNGTYATYLFNEQNKPIVMADKSIGDKMRQCSNCNANGDIYQAHAVYCHEHWHHNVNGNTTGPGLGDPCKKKNAPHAALYSIPGDGARLIRGHWSTTV